jgi:hypothetical protein
MSMSKTLIGKNNILFLNNDTCEELKVHCDNLLKVADLSLSRYKFDNFILFVYPNKCLIYKDYLPDEYIFRYRPALDIYKNVLQNKVHDLYDVLKGETNVYYKTDTHINVKGNYIIYHYFIGLINSLFHLTIQPKHLSLAVKNVPLKTLPYGIGDLTWDQNLGDQTLNDINDDYFYFTDNYICFYPEYVIKNDSNIRFLNYDLGDNTALLEGKNADWNIISQHIIYVKNENKIPLKVIIFYDSFLLNVLSLYFDLFNEIYFIKDVYSIDKIDMIHPDYIFEFRVERFLF